MENKEKKNPTVAELIKAALLKDIGLSEEEYREKRLNDDKITKAQGIKGRAPAASESIRARRMAMNFYGTVLNILVNIHASNLEMIAEQKKTNQLLGAIISEATDGENNE